MKRFLFHGAYKHKRDAVQKERRVNGAFIRPRKIHGHIRYLVMTKRK